MFDSLLPSWEIENSRFISKDVLSVEIIKLRTAKSYEIKTQQIKLNGRKTKGILGKIKISNMIFYNIYKS